MPVILAFSFNYPANIYLVLAVGPAKPSALVIMVDNTEFVPRGQEGAGMGNKRRNGSRSRVPCRLVGREMDLKSHI